MNTSARDSTITGHLFSDFLLKYNVLFGTLVIYSKTAESLKGAVETFALHILPKSCLNFEYQYLIFATICYLEKGMLELQIPKLRDKSVSIVKKL